jgi:hypothetical protein
MSTAYLVHNDLRQIGDLKGLEQPDDCNYYQGNRDGARVHPADNFSPDGQLAPFCFNDNEFTVKHANRNKSSWNHKLQPYGELLGKSHATH